MYNGDDMLWQGGGTPEAAYAYAGLDQPLMRLSGPGNTSGTPDAVAEYYAQDGIGSVRAMLSSLNGLNGVASQSFDVWGNLTQASGGSISTYGFTGREPDATGLMYYRTRYYHPGYGRFISREPIGLAGGINPYAYADGNPVRFNDPSGLLAAAVGNIAQDYTGRAVSAVGSFVAGLDPLGALDQFGRKLAGDFFQNHAGTWGPLGGAADLLATYASGFDGASSNGQLASGLAVGASLAGGVVGKAKGAARAGETAATAYGRQAHINYENTLGGSQATVFNQRIPTTLLRPDAIDWANNVVRELKPDSASGIRTGLRQLDQYVAELQRVTGQVWQGVLDRYKRPGGP